MTKEEENNLYGRRYNLISFLQEQGFDMFNLFFVKDKDKEKLLNNFFEQDLVKNKRYTLGDCIITFLNENRSHCYTDEELCDELFANIDDVIYWCEKLRKKEAVNGFNGEDEYSNLNYFYTSKYGKLDFGED